MKARGVVIFILNCSVAAVPHRVAGQGRATAKAASATTSATPNAYPKPTNLQVLPKETSGEDIDKLMHRYQEYLGVPCGYCHEENAQTRGLNYASDENPIKQTARFMISMTSDINSKYLSQVGDRRYAEPFTCGNCHRGQVQPPAFELKP